MTPALRVRAAGCRALLMDVSADIPVDQVAAATGRDIALLRAMPRGEAVEAISAAECMIRLLRRQ